jgi:hypothetical protein
MVQELMCGPTGGVWCCSAGEGWCRDGGLPLARSGLPARIAELPRSEQDWPSPEPSSPRFHAPDVQPCPDDADDAPRHRSAVAILNALSARIDLVIAIWWGRRRGDPGRR